MDAVIDFAAGQTFGAFSYPDATTLAKGIVQIDAVGGLAVAAGVVSLTDTAVVPGTYTKTTVDQKGRVTAGALARGWRPARPTPIRRPISPPDRCRSRSRTTARRSEPGAR